MNDAVSPPGPEAAVLGEQLFCEQELGLGWKTVAELPEPRALARLNARNEAVLRTLALVEEHDETQSEDAERAELHRLEAKLNMALELLAELVCVRQEAIPARLVRFNSLGFCWQAPESFAAETLLLVECYPLLAWPVPLRLYARVLSSEPRDAEFRIGARLEGLSEGVRNWLEKLVFRRHRRAIAQSRITREAHL